MNCLHHVTYGFILVTHGAGQRRRKSSTSQSCAQFAATIRSSAGCSGQNGSRLLCLSSPSISISTTSRTIETGCSVRRCKNCFYREAFGNIGRTSARIRQQKRPIAQRYCEPCSGGFSPAEKKAWVNGQPVGTTQFNWNIVLIACYQQSWKRSTSCWCPTSDGQSKRLRRN